MKRQIWPTSTPGHAVSTMKALIGRFPLTPSRGGSARHDYQQGGARAVRGPQLLAVEDVVRSVRGGLSEGGHVGRVGPHIQLGQCEGRQLAAGSAGKVLALLLLGAEEHQGRGYADGLVRGEERSRGGAAAGDQGEGPVVGCLRQSETPVLARDLDPVGAQLGEALQHRVGNPCVAVDGVAVHMLLRKAADALEEGCGSGRLFGVLGG